MRRAMGFEPSLDAVRESAGAGVAHAFSMGLRNAFLTMMVLLLTAMAVSAFKWERAKEQGMVTAAEAPQTPD